MKKSTLPALNDESMRRLNAKKVMDTIEGIGEYVSEAKKSAKATKYYLIGLIITILFLIGGSYIALAYASGGASNFFKNMFITENANNRIVCTNQGNNITMEYRTPEQAYYHLKVFDSGSFCEIKTNDQIRLENGV